MKAKLVTTCLLATVFCTTVPTIVSAQSSDIRCENNDTLLETMRDCDPDSVKKLNVDPSTTGSVNNASGVSNSKSNNNSDATSSDDGPNSADDGSSTAGDDDHDNGHGNDPDHDDSSNPGKGGGNHGAGK